MNTCTKCCNCTNEKLEKVERIICECKQEKGALLLVLHKTQELYGYLPIEALKVISEGMGVSMAEIYGVVTFYKQFTLEPRGKYSISVCLGTACYVRGAGEILQKFKEKLGIDIGGCTDDGKFSLNDARCLGACGLAPVVMINDDVYGKVNVKDIDVILEKYKD